MKKNHHTKPTLHIILTGGTIDSHYDADKCTVFPGQKSVVPEFLNQVAGMSHMDIAVSQVCMKDSRDITSTDVDKVKSIIEIDPANRFVVTHGTFTLSQTAKTLESGLKREDATVILTGSMIPLEGFCNSDAGFNLGVAVAHALNSDPGVFVCIFGKKWQPDQVPCLHS